MNCAAIKDQVRIEEVMGRVVPLTRHGTWYRGRCPFHADRHPSLVVWSRTQTWKCLTCSPVRDDVIGFVARWHQCSTAEALRWLRQEFPLTRLSPGPRRLVAPAAVVAALSVRDQTYRAWLGRLSLSTAHRQALHARGLSDQAIQRAGLVTHASGPVVGVSVTSGVPGFTRRAGHWHVRGPAGFLIPVRDVSGHIQGVQIRVDDSRAGKYRWLSSAGQPGGASSGAPLHVARGVDDIVWITEGPLKAIIAHDRLHHTVLGIPGVGAWQGVPAMLADLHPHRVVIAFDQDADPATRAAVAQHRDGLTAVLQAAGWPVYHATWNGPKGLDDALVAGARMTVTASRRP